jgi:hypothetical protein
LIPLAAALNGAITTNAQPPPPLLVAGLPLPGAGGLPTRADCEGATAGLPLLPPTGEPRFCDEAGAGWTGAGAAGAEPADVTGAGTEELWESCELCEEW